MVICVVDIEALRPMSCAAWLLNPLLHVSPFLVLSHVTLPPSLSFDPGELRQCVRDSGLGLGGGGGGEGRKAPGAHGVRGAHGA